MLYLYRSYSISEIASLLSSVHCILSKFNGPEHKLDAFGEMILIQYLMGFVKRKTNFSYYSTIYTWHRRYSTNCLFVHFVEQSLLIYLLMEIIQDRIPTICRALARLDLTRKKLQRIVMKHSEDSRTTFREDVNAI